MDAQLIEGIAGAVALLAGPVAIYFQCGMALEARKGPDKLAFFLNPLFSDAGHLTPRGRVIRRRFMAAFSVFALAVVAILLAQTFD